MKPGNRHSFGMETEEGTVLILAETIVSGR